MRRTLTAALVAGSLLLASGIAASPLSAASTPGSPGAWPAWTITPDDPKAQDHSGTIAFGLPGMPDATYTVTKTAADDESTRLVANDEEYLAADTPIGQVFGASGPSTDTQFLRTAIDSDVTESATVVVTFAAPVPAGLLGFAVGDVDVDQVVVSATQPGGAALSGEQLAGQAFNLCDSTTQPESCEGATAPFPVPTWDPATGTVLGSGDDSDGESAWFRPTVSVTSLTFVFSGQFDISSSFRLWLTARQTSIGGTVTSTCAAATEPATLSLTGPGGAAVQTVTPAANGSFAFDPVLAVDGYQVGVTAPPGCAVVGTNPVAVDGSTGNPTLAVTLVDAAPAPPLRPTFTG